MAIRRSLSLVVLSAVVFTGGLAACGDDSNSSSGAGGGSTSMANDFVSAVNAIGKGDCSKASTFAETVDNLDPMTSGSTFKDLAKAFEQLGSSGPSEVKADFATVGKGLAQFAKVFEGLDLSDPEQFTKTLTDPAKAAEMEKVMAAMDEKAMDEASDRIGAWIEKKCPGLGAPATTKG